MTWKDWLLNDLTLSLGVVLTGGLILAACSTPMNYGLVPTQVDAVLKACTANGGAPASLSTEWNGHVLLVCEWEGKVPDGNR